MLDIKQLQEKLEKYNEEIKNNEIKKANIEGRQEGILEKLKSEFNIIDIKEIDIYIEDNTKEVERLENEINTNVEKLESFDEMED